jgi:uncharacterized damage-inducible protein DinB
LNADAFRHLYDYHFEQNRSLWDGFIARLTDEEFSRPVDYSIGSPRNHVIHMMSVDRAWFSPLWGDPDSSHFAPDSFPDRAAIRAQWDAVEGQMRAFLAGLRDEQLEERPYPDDEEDNQLRLWQVLLHVANHGTDHRAQVLRVLHDFGYRTPPQDYIFYVYDHLV